MISLAIGRFLTTGLGAAIWASLQPHLHEVQVYALNGLPIFNTLLIISLLSLSLSLRIFHTFNIENLSKNDFFVA